jgi:uncharacterized protein YdaU (DUF1376 family)
MGLRLLLPSLDQTHRRQDEETAGQRCESDIAEVVAQPAEHRYEAEAKPPCEAAQPIAETHERLQ